MPIEHRPSAAERLELALSATQDAVAWTDEFGRVQWCNPRFERACRRARAEILGSNIIDLLALERCGGTRPMVEHPAAQVLKTRGQVAGCYETRSEGATAYWDLVGTWIQAKNGPPMAVFVLRDITARREAEQAAARLASIVNSTEAAVFSWGLDGTIVSWNPAAERLFGYKASEIKGKPVSLLDPDAARGETERLGARARKGERVAHYETTRVGKGGRVVEVALTISPFRDDDGRVAGVCAVGRGTSEELLARRELTAAKNELRRLVDGLPAMIMKLSAEGRFVLLNRAAERLAGPRPEALLGQRFHDAPWWPDAAARRRARGLLERGLEGESTSCRETLKVGDKTLEAMVSVSPLRGEDAAVEGVLIELRDVTEQAREERQARDLELSMHVLIDGVEDYAIFMLDREGRVASWNAGARRINGYTRDEIVGRPYEVFFPEEDRKAGLPARILEEAARAGRVENEDVWRVRKDGTRYLSHMVMTALRDERGRLRGFAKVTRDVTEQARLRREREKWETIFRHAGWGAAVVDPATDVFEAVNDGFARMHGYEPKELIGKPLKLTYAPEAVEELEKHLKVVRDTGHHIYEAVHVRKDGTRFPVMTDVTAFRDDASGQTLHRAAYFIDISERKRAEERLREKAEELARSNRELEQFASAASHDLLEPLRKITAFSDLLKRQSEKALDDRSKDFLERIRHAAARMATLIEDLLKFSRVFGETRPFEPVDLNRVLAEVVSDLDTSIVRTGAEITILKLPTVRAHAFQMRQLFQNLLANAIKFQAPGTKPRVRVEARAPRPGFIEISVSDNGIGFDQKDAEKIFEPFLRLHTRAEYEGSGIGLAVCRRIMMRHGGWISASSERGKGSTFTITLPDGGQP